MGDDVAVSLPLTDRRGSARSGLPLWHGWRLSGVPLLRRRPDGSCACWQVFHCASAAAIFIGWYLPSTTPNTIGPLWDGNEVWLVVAGASMFAAFPGWYATIFSAFNLALVLSWACTQA